MSALRDSPGAESTSQNSAAGATSQKPAWGATSQNSARSVGPEVLPYIPPPTVLWRSFVTIVWAAMIVWIVDGVVDLFVQFWFNTSLGFKTLFWTNLRAQAVLFALGGAVYALAIGLPLRRYAASPALRRAAIHVAAWASIIGGWALSRYYAEYLLAFNGGGFGQSDTVFGHDIGFYVFRLPFIWAIFRAVYLPLFFAMAALLVARFDALRSAGIVNDPEVSLLGRASLLLNPGFNTLFYAVGFVGAAGTFLSRYELLYRDNEASGIRGGAEYLDVIGVFSTLNAIYVTTVVEVGVTLLVGVTLFRLYNHYKPIELAEETSGPAIGWRFAGLVLLGLLVLDASFFVAVAVRDRVYVTPNEPFIQQSFIQHHMDATLEGYRLQDVEVVDWIPPEKPLTPEQIFASKTVQNVPILPGYVSYLEARSPDLQHAARYEMTDTTMVYGPMLEVFEQEQQLRPYYSFINVDTVRYRVNGEKKMYVSATREIPSDRVVGPQDWLKNWGTSTLLYTHGLGLVMSPANLVDPSGEPLYVVDGIPPHSEEPAFESEPRIYYGEGGTGTYVLTNIRHLKEFDYATQQFREEYVLPENVEAGIRIDSRFKRSVFALWSIQRGGDDFTAFLFSSFIDTDRTRIHLNRSPLERAGAVAPFLFLDDASIYAVVAEGRIVWLVNALITSNRYPYSLREELGDKATDRSPEELQFSPRLINYAEDSVKVTIDAYTGATRFYKIADDPLVNAWEKIYPDLFHPAASMPDSVEAQLTYPLQWFHTQFDDVYKRYHQRNYVEFYNLEDLWDDADEVLGPIGVGLTPFGNTDESTFSFEGYHVLLDTEDLPPGTGLDADNGDTQFAMLMPFTPEGGRNLRSLIVALQDPGRYGELYSLRIPQGTFVTGPEQADSIIDADARVNQQLTLWVRHGAQVMAGHTLLLPVRGDVLYVQPIFVKSTQNAIPQIRLFSVVHRGRVTMAPTLAEAIRLQGLPPVSPADPTTGVMR